jgi:Flp pilus assembly pilin Flp
MSDITLRTAARTQIAVSRFTSSLAQYAQRVAERARREQTGQDVIEYAGLVVLVAALIAALFVLHIDTTVKTAVGKALSGIFGGGSGAAPAGGQ